MDTLPITLIVKAPNQQIEDQTIKCESSWTIDKLKQHLSEVYPNKPPQQEQKLIYSGKLLSDTLILKDVLRQYEGQDTHTVHLVCTPKFTPQNVRNINENNARVAVTETTANNTPTVENNMNHQRVPNMQWYHYNAQNMNQYPQNVQVDQYAMHMFMMQQAYMQYMTQYMNMAAQQYQGVTNAIPAQQQPQAIAANGADIPDGAPLPVPAQVREPVRDPDLNRDWLDVFYMLSRVMIFTSIVYFYSSPIRCIFVVFLGILLYLYQIGFFGNVNNNNNNLVQGGETVEPQAPTRLMIIWTFFTTFFASLIPEIPNVV